MRRLISTTFVSLDGVMQAPGGPGEDESGGFALGGWTVPYWDEAMGVFMDELMGSPFDLVLGRKTYDVFAAHWPHADGQEARRLVSSTTSSTGVVMAVYAPVGEVQTGSFALD